MIRALALLLLLANLAYHLWSLQRPPPPGSAPSPEPLPAGVERLLLLSERPPEPPPTRTPSPVPRPPTEAVEREAGPAELPASPPPAPGREAEAAPAASGAGPALAERPSDPAAGDAALAAHCERIGPLEPAVAARLVEALRRAGGQAELVPDPELPAPAAIQLYVPAPASFAEAREIVRALGEAGLEAYVMGREEISGAVSVGLFTEPERARDRRARVEALGYEVAERELGPAPERPRVAVRLPAPAIGRTLAGLDGAPEAFPRESVPCVPQEPDPASEQPDS
jgi:hypothetical protein